MSAPSVTVFVGLSLDGFMADQHGAIDWLDPWAAESTANTGYDELMARVDTLLIGRRFYDTVCGFGAWPYPGKVVTVLSHRPIVARHGEISAQGPIDRVLIGLWRRSVISTAAWFRPGTVDGADLTRLAGCAASRGACLSWPRTPLGS